MATAPQSPKSGNPAKQAQIDLSVKQKREEAKKEKLAEYQRSLSKRKRTKTLWWVVGVVATLAVVTGITLSYVLAPKPYPAATYDAPTGAKIEGVQTYDYAGAQHVEGTVDYAETPPVGGAHNNRWLTCVAYSEPQTSEYAVHSLEHGSIWLTYDPDRVSEADIEKLRSYLPADYAILSPFEGMDTPIAVSGWNRQLKVDSASDPRIAKFFQEYWQAGDVPEPGASCTGIAGPGRL